jgi:hypothetical protein
VSAVRAHGGIAVEFLQLSKTGQSLLADLLAELAQLGERTHLAKLLRWKAERKFFPFPNLLTTTVGPQLQPEYAEDSGKRTAKPEPRIVTPIDLFG